MNLTLPLLAGVATIGLYAGIKPTDEGDPLAAARGIRNALIICAPFVVFVVVVIAQAIR